MARFLILKDETAINIELITHMHITTPENRIYLSIFFVDGNVYNLDCQSKSRAKIMADEIIEKSK